MFWGVALQISKFTLLALLFEEYISDLCPPIEYPECSAGAPFLFPIKTGKNRHFCLFLSLFVDFAARKMFGRIFNFLRPTNFAFQEYSPRECHQIFFIKEGNYSYK